MQTREGWQRQLTGLGEVMAKPLWFGPRRRPLFGWLHTPADGRARAAVVLCPPLGIEALCVHFSFRVLAGQLAARGLAVVRFDYDGTGDSFGSEDDDDRVGAWQRSVTAAVDLAGATGVGPVGLVGMRLGALLAAGEAARRGGVDAMALWDPCSSGTAFLREQRVMRMVSVGGEEQGGVDTLGAWFSTQTVGALDNLDLSKLPKPLASALLVAEHPQRPGGRRLRRQLSDTAEWIEATGQSELLDPPRQTPPWALIERVAAWMDRHLGGSPVPVREQGDERAVVGVASDGGEITERPISVAPAGLFGMLTEPAASIDAPGILLVDEGNTPHIGQARMWVEVARAWAAAGLRVLRFDLSGNGDSDQRPGGVSHQARAPEAFDDVVDAARALSPGDPSAVVLVGFCAGAYQAMEVALSHRVAGTCLLNPAVAFVPPEPRTEASLARRQACQASRSGVVRALEPLVRLATRRAPEDQREEWFDALRSGSWLQALAVRMPRVPSAVWWLLARLLVVSTPTETLARLVARDVETFVLCGPADLEVLSFAAERRLAALSLDPRFDLQVLDGLEHVAMVREQRRTVVGHLREHVIAAYARGRPAALPSAAASSTARNSRARSVQVGGDDVRGPGPGGAGG